MLTSKQLENAQQLRRGDVNRLLEIRARHTARIETLKRVLDPNDTEAKMLSPNEQSYRDELARREEELAAVEAQIVQALNKE